MLCAARLFATCGELRQPAYPVQPSIARLPDGRRSIRNSGGLHLLLASRTTKRRNGLWGILRDAATACWYLTCSSTVIANGKVAVKEMNAFGSSAQHWNARNKYSRKRRHTIALPCSPCESKVYEKRATPQRSSATYELAPLVCYSGLSSPKNRELPFADAFLGDSFGNVIPAVLRLFPYALPNLPLSR